MNLFCSEAAVHLKKIKNNEEAHICLLCAVISVKFKKSLPAELLALHKCDHMRMEDQCSSCFSEGQTWFRCVTV